MIGAILITILAIVALIIAALRDRQLCDMYNTDLCKHYRGRYACMYGRAHGVKRCPYGKLDYYEDQKCQDESCGNAPLGCANPYYCPKT